MTVISLERARARLRAPVRVEPPAALASARPAQRANAADAGSEDRLRMRQNLAAFLIVAIIVTTGTWLMTSLHHYSQLQACLLAGHRNCLPVQAEYAAQPYRR